MLKTANSAMLSFLAISVIASPAVVAQPQQATSGIPADRLFLRNESPTDIRREQILGFTGPSCGHIVDLMLRNQLQRQMGVDNGPGETATVHLPHLSVGMKPGDLRLKSVVLIRDGTTVSGPIFEIGLCNCSSIPIGNFHVSIAAVLGQLQICSPMTEGCIRRMEAGEECTIVIQLPARAMSMSDGGNCSPFTSVVVAIDSYDDLLECDELNNVLILKRDELLSTMAPAPPQELRQPTDPQPQIQLPESPADPENPLQRIDVDRLVPQAPATDAQSLLLKS